MPVRRTLVFCLLVLVCGCASTTYQETAGDGQIQDAMEQPFRDVSWMREDPPDILIRAVEAPYQWDLAASCADIRAEISELDLVLGPDLDLVPEEKEESSSDENAILSGAIGGLIGLSYRGIVRRLSGAEHRDRALRKAILAGMVRRGFMKGLAAEAKCPMPDLLLPEKISPSISDLPVVEPINHR